jgi:drug/metabolite transporter (DMT)-like permease
VAKIWLFVYIALFLSLLFIRLIVGETILPSSIAGLALIAAGFFLHGRIPPRGASA